VPGENLTRDEAGERARRVSVDSYDVMLDLTKGDSTFESDTTVRFSAAPGSSTFIDLIAPSVASVTLNGVALDTAVFDGSRIPLSDLA
jgi:aminopeptidase N